MTPNHQRFCRCQEPFGDEREGVCARCGHRVRGYDIPVRGVFSLTGDDRSSFAKPVRKYRPAA